MTPIYNLIMHNLAIAAKKNELDVYLMSMATYNKECHWYEFENFYVSGNLIEYIRQDPDFYINLFDDEE